MQNTVYRASRIPFIYAAFLLACAIQVWQAPAVHYSLWCCASTVGSPLAIGSAVSGLFKALQSPLWGYFALALLGVDAVQELRKRPMCFPIKLAVHEAAAISLGIGIMGVLILAEALALDARFPLHGTTLTALTPSLPLALTSNSSWATIGVLCKGVGVLGVALVLSFGRRPPRR